jgi:hypothetical protein
MAHTHARTFVEPYLTFTSYLTLRILCPILAYIPLSLSYALIQLPFNLPFESRFTFGGGFVLFFVYIWLGMCALGLALEAMITILTPRFVPFFLVLMVSGLSVLLMRLKWFCVDWTGMDVDYRERIDCCVAA